MIAVENKLYYVANLMAVENKLYSSITSSVQSLEKLERI